MATWNIETLNYTNDSDKIVIQGHWRYEDSKEANGEVYTASTYGAVSFDDIKADASGFIAYTDLTEAKCLEWVHAKVDKTEIEARVAAEVTAKVTPAYKNGKPW